MTAPSGERGHVPNYNPARPSRIGMTRVEQDAAAILSPAGQGNPEAPSAPDPVTFMADALKSVVDLPFVFEKILRELKFLHDAFDLAYGPAVWAATGENTNMAATAYPAQTAAQLAPPAAPAPTQGGAGTVAAGTYGVIVSYTNPAGETIGSAAGSVTVAVNTSIVIPSPAASGNATGWYAYVTQVGGNVYTRQQAAGSPTAIGTGLTISAPPTNGGANPPAATSAFVGGTVPAFYNPSATTACILRNIVVGGSDAGIVQLVLARIANTGGGPNPTLIGPAILRVVGTVRLTAAQVLSVALPQYVVLQPGESLHLITSKSVATTLDFSAEYRVMASE